MSNPMCINCRYFEAYDLMDLFIVRVKIDDFQKRMSDGFCHDPDPLDDNMPRFKGDWCEHFTEKVPETKLSRTKEKR